MEKNKSKSHNITQTSLETAKDSNVLTSKNSTNNTNPKI